MKTLTEKIKAVSKDYYEKKCDEQIEKAFLTCRFDRKEININLMKANGRNFVYLLEKNKNVIYVGRTKRIYDRLVSHKSKKDFDKIALLEFIDKGQCNEAEYYFIKYYKPSLNKVWVTIGLNKYDSI